MKNNKYYETNNRGYKELKDAKVESCKMDKIYVKRAKYYSIEGKQLKLGNSRKFELRINI